MTTIDEIPEEFICPITQTLMRDPYVDKDGNSYEKNAIMDWLRRNPISPITRNRMSINDVFPNRTLKSIIETFRQSNPDLCGPADSKDDVAEGKDNKDSNEDNTPLNPTEARRQLGRKPFVLFAVIDVSGSMQNPCDSASRHDGSREQEGFSRLDLVKHTLNTIIMSLSRYDQICIVKFSTSASVYIPLTRLTEACKPDLIARY
ncbi:VWA domain-containing protein [archaeon]|nr:MAG: VWA domain-containing protein [archaeon]